jgi:hypothetical protein
MRRVLISSLSGLIVFMLLAPTARAGKFNPAEFPLRVHVVYRNGVRHYYRPGGYGSISSLDQVDGMGGGDLFENSQPLGFDFNYDCSQPITPMPGYETFMARWKKPGRVIEILMPVMGGKPGDMNSCELNVTMKQDTVYVRRNGGVIEEPAAKYKDWMIKHQYDPEHGLNEPVNAPAEQPPAEEPTQPQAPPSGTQ